MSLDITQNTTIISKDLIAPSQLWQDHIGLRKNRISAAIISRLRRIDMLLSTADLLQEWPWQEINKDIVSICSMKKNSLFVKKIPKGEPDNFREDTEDFIHLIGNLNVEPFLQACAYDKINERYGPRLKKLVSLELSANLPDTDISDWISEVESTTTWWKFFIQLPEWKQISLLWKAQRYMWRIIAELSNNYQKYGKEWVVSFSLAGDRLVITLRNKIKEEVWHVPSTHQGLMHMRMSAWRLGGVFDTRKEGEMYTAIVTLPLSRIQANITSQEDWAPFGP